MRLGIQLLLLGLLLFAAPVLVGGLFLKVDRLGGNLFFRWISGQFLIWAGFQLICVPLILREETFPQVVQLFSGYLTALVLLAVAMAYEVARVSAPAKARSVNKYPLSAPL